MKKRLNDTIKVKGMFRVHITEGDGRLVGDSGWQHNAIVNDGFHQYLVMAVMSSNGSKSVSHLTLGSGGAPGATTTSLPGEVLEASKRQAVTAATSAGSKTVRFTGTFLSSNSFISTTYNLSNIGLVNSVSSGTLFAGNTFASSSCATNQNVNTTYDITFA